jgi:peroxiredoxin
MKSKLLFLIPAIFLCVQVEAANIPRPAPDLTIKLTGGKTAQLSDYKGKVIALEFLLTTCSHCQSSSKKLSRLQQEYGLANFQAVGVAVNPMSHMLVPDYLKDFQLTFPVGYDVPETAHTFLEHPTTLRLLMPQLVLIDRAGNIRFQHTGDLEESQMRSEIEKLLKEPQPSTPKAAAKK